MKMNELLILGDEELYKTSEDVQQSELDSLKPRIDDLHQIVTEFRETYGAGRAIAAPQIGLLKRIICFNVEEPMTLINPRLHDKSDEMIELWDDCMSFPNLLVKVKRHKSCKISFRDLNWKEITWDLNENLSKLFQHEYDHLDGILAIERAIDKRSFKYKTKPVLNAS